MTKKAKLNVLPLIIISLMFPVFVIGIGWLLDVDTIDAAPYLELERQQQGETVYRLLLPSPPDERHYELMFTSEGNILQVSDAAGAVLYEYGQELAGRGLMIGRVYAHAYLPPGAYAGPLRIRLIAADANASPALLGAELCPHSETAHYYITNQTLGMPIAMVLLSMAFCVPVFLMMGSERRRLHEGFLFGCVLVCLSVLLMDGGGHYLVLFSDQHAWVLTAYIAKYLLPVFALLYFRELEGGRLQRRILLAGALLNLAFLIVACALALAGAAQFCDLEPAYRILLTADGLIGAYEVYWSHKRKRISRIKRILLNAVVLWVLVFVVSSLLSIHLIPTLGLPRFDWLSAVAVLLFYTLCALYAESAVIIHRGEQAREARIETLEKSQQSALSVESIAKVLSETYESIYAIDVETGAYTCYYESSAHGELGVASSGEDFYQGAVKNIPKIVYPDDRDYTLQMLSRQAVLQGTQDGRHYTFIHRIVAEDGTPIYHQIRAIRQTVGESERILLGVRDIDMAMRREKEHIARQESMLQKEVNHLEAILASAAAYLEANLSRDIILERSYNHSLGGFSPQENEENEKSFSRFMQRWAAVRVVEERAHFLEVNDRAALLERFGHGERRTSVSFSVRTDAGELQPCRQVIYLYRDKASEEVMCFTVVYDLTDQQKQEKEIKELEDALRMSRIRVFTGQMQPHFLYNALGSIQEIVLDDPEYASELIGDFTTHLRSSIRAMSSDEPVPFPQELENIHAYVNIEKMRFGDKLKVEYDIGVSDFAILPLSIQPLVENAIRHGVYERGPRGGTVTIRSRETPGAWVVEVADDGVGFDTKVLRREVEEGRRDSTGLKNLMFRLDKVMHAGVEIESTPGVGTRVIVTIPKGEPKSESDHS